MGVQIYIYIYTYTYLIIFTPAEIINLDDFFCCNMTWNHQLLVVATWLHDFQGIIPLRRRRWHQSEGCVCQTWMEWCTFDGVINPKQNHRLDVENLVRNGDKLPKPQLLSPSLSINSIFGVFIEGKRSYFFWFWRMLLTVTVTSCSTCTLEVVATLRNRWNFFWMMINPYFKDGETHKATLKRMVVGLLGCTYLEDHPN